MGLQVLTRSQTERTFHTRPFGRSGIEKEPIGAVWRVIFQIRNARMVVQFPRIISKMKFGIEIGLLQDEGEV